MLLCFLFVFFPSPPELANNKSRTRIRIVSKDKQPLDLSKEKHVEAFKRSVGAWAKQKADNKDGTHYGHVEIEGLDLNPYGVPYEA